MRQRSPHSVSQSMLVALVGLVGLSGCITLPSDDVNNDDTAVASALARRGVAVGGNIEGLAGPILILRNNNRDTLVVHGNGPFRFPELQSVGATYSVTIQHEPMRRESTCTVINGTGTVGTTDVTNILVHCGKPPPPPPTYTIGGAVTGLTGTVVLRNNGGDDLVLSAPGAFAFATAQLAATAYAVTVAHQPDGQLCSVANANGIVAGANVSTVAVACVATTPTFYVDAATGNDSNPGTAASPWRTITKATHTAPTTGADIHIAPGTYTTGETFPISPRANQHLIGDVANRGEGATPTRIVGGGAFVCTGGDLGNFAVDVAVGLEAAAQGASIAGFSIAGGDETVWICNVQATLASNTVSGSTDTSVLIGYRANVTLTDNVIRDGAYGLLAYDPETKVYARDNTISASTNHAVVLGFTNPFTGANMNFGTAASPGNNTLLGSAVGVGLAFQATTSSVVNATGNTWHASKQGADASGHYAAQLVTTPNGGVAGTNFSTRFTTGGGLQL